MSHIFHGVQFCVDFASSLLSFKEKQEIRRNIVDNGGTLSYILTKQISYLVTGNSERTLSSYKGRTAVKNGIAVVSIDFVRKCIESGKLLDPQPYLLSETRDSQNFSSGKIACQSEVNKKQTKSVKKLRLPDINKIQVWKYKSADAPIFDEQSYEIAKDLVLKGTDSSGSIVLFYALELHVVPPQVPCSGSRYRLFTHHGNLKRLREGDPGTKECRYFSTVEDALDAYTALDTQQTQAPYSLTRAESVLSHKIGSDKMIQITVSEHCPEEDTVLSPEVANLIDFIWNEATGSLSDILAVSADSIKLEDVEKAEAVLLLLKRSLDSAEDSSVLKKLSDEFFSIIPHRNTGTAISSKYLIAQKQDLCQLIKDMVSVGESTNWLTRRSLYSKYRALKCHIEWLQHESDEFKKIQEHVNASETSPSKIQVLNVFSIMRPIEEGTFSHDIQNKKLLFHSSKVTNFVGILSRGLLMPKIIVEDFGGKRSDAGMLGSGIYFASSASTSAKYSAAASNGTRLMLVNEVALGNIKELRKFSMDLTSAPTGFDSCHGVQNTEGEPSDFKDDEFAVYSGNQQRLRYLVEFVLPGDNVLPRDDVSLDSGFSDEEVEDMEGSAVDLSDVMSVVDPLTKVEVGLKGTGDKPLPLQSVHIRAKLLDLAAQVIVFQAYKNNSSSPIEAKYVFPLDDMAAVCGFEAFINGKHIVGEVKEKEQAHKEYREAISQGHGAYLMDEETPDVFTVSVGNLPPGAQVLIKITYVAELLVEREHICFSLPGSVAPWKRNKALEEITQTDVDTVHIDEKGSSDVLDVSVQVSVEMPFDIRTIDSPSHSIRIKRTATKAVVSLEDGQSLEDGFQLLIGLAEIHVPRMWVERHISKPDSQACMLTFYPEFEAETPREVEVLFLLDLSCSMKGPPLEDAKKILLMCLSLMNKDWIFNILVFGSKQFELFPSSKRNDPEAYKDAVKFVQSLSATKGSTELWRVLQKLSLLPAVSSADHPRNLFLISDGHVTEEETTLCLIHKNYRSDRLFTFGVGATANRYYLRAMSKAGAGASEFFDSKVKSKWERKVKSQLSKAEQPGLTSVAVSWQQHDSGSSPPVQAPHQILSLFNGSRQVVYGFVDNCTQATLSAEVNGKTVSTMVYTSDLNITTGKILHQLTARALIRDWDEGSLHEQRTGHEVVKRNRKDYIISISKEFSVVSKFTSFVAVEHREKDEKFEEGQGPSIEELVAAEEIDILQYIGWEQKPVDTDRRREPCIEEKLEKQLQEAEVLETCAVLQCERLYNDVMKEARDKLGPDHPLTTKTAYALSNLYQSVFGDKEKALQVIITDNVLDDHSEDEDFEDSEDDDWSSDEWSEQDELPEALLMQQDDQEKRSTTSGSSPSGSDEVDGKEEEDLQQIEDSSIEEVDTGRREKRSERKWLTNLTRGDSDSAPSEAGEQEMSMAISKSAACSFVDDEEEKSEDEVGFGVYGAFKKFAGKVTNKALQSEESPKYSPTSPSLQIEETTLSPSKKELKRSRSKEVSTGDASDLLESAECVPEPRIGRIAVRLGSTRRGRPARKPALQDFSFDQSTQQLQKPPPSPPFPPPPPGASVTTAPPLAYAPPGGETVGGGLHTSEAVSAIVEPEREIRPPHVESSLSGFTLNSVDPDRRGVCFGSSSTGEVGGFGQSAHEKKKPGFSATELFGSAPDRQRFSFGSPSTGEIVGFGQSAHEKKKPGFSATELFGSASDRQNLSFGSPSTGEIVGFGQSAHEKEKSGIPATGLFGSSQSAPSIVGGGLFGNREPRLLAGQSELTAPSFSSGQQSFGSVPSVTSGGGSLFGVPIPAVQAVTVVKDGGEKAEIIEERTGSLEESDGSLADIDFPIAMSKKKKKKRAVIIEEELTQLSDETEPPMPIRQDQAVPAYPFLRSTFNLPTSKAPSSLPSGSKSSVPPSHHPPPPPPCSVDPVTTVPPAPPFPPLIVGGVEKRSSSLRPPLRPPAGISVPTPPFSSRVSASAPSRRQQLLSSIKSSGGAASFGGHRTTVHSALMRAQQQQRALFARSYKGMTMQTDIPVAVSEGVTNRACDSAVSETVGECGSVASPEATLLSEWRESAGVARGGSPDRQEIMTEEERTNKKVNVEELERKMLGRRRGAVSNRTQRDRNETMEKIFAKQNPDGFWNVDDLSVIGISKRNFINFLGNAGARSLGPKVFELALQLLSTLVILAFIKLRLSIDMPLSLPLGKKRELKVDGLGEPYSKNITAALRWIKIQEQKLPLLYSRLEFGVNWDVATRNIVQEMAV